MVLDDTLKVSYCYLAYDHLAHADEVEIEAFAIQLNSI